MSDHQDQNSAPQTLKNACARLMAVQAFYQMRQNGQKVRDVYDEYINHRAEHIAQEQGIATPDGALLKRILFGIDERFVELDSIINANLHKDASDRVIEPLLTSVLMCGAYEILVHHEYDAPIIINDYLNVGHAFFAKNEVALINGVLDSLAKLLR